MYEYKVLTERDKLFSGSFNPELLQVALNQYAAEGWRLREGFMVASVWKSAKTEVMLILEREVGE